MLIVFQFSVSNTNWYLIFQVKPKNGPFRVYFKKSIIIIHCISNWVEDKHEDMLLKVLKLENLWVVATNKKYLEIHQKSAKIGHEFSVLAKHEHVGHKLILIQEFNFVLWTWLSYLCIKSKPKFLKEGIFVTKELTLGTSKWVADFIDGEYSSILLFLTPQRFWSGCFFYQIEP